MLTKSFMAFVSVRKSAVATTARINSQAHGRYRRMHLATEFIQEAPTNPFTPSEIASGPDEFFGRADELRDIRAAIEKGSIVIQGPVGIGKSSLLAQSRLDLEGFGSEKRAFSGIAVG